MKDVKLLGLLAVWVLSLHGLGGTASADTLTGPLGEPTPKLHWTSEGHVKVFSLPSVAECPATKNRVVVSHGSGIKVRWEDKETIFGPCTNSWHVTVDAAGEESIEYIAPGEGTVRSTGMTITGTRFGINCRLATNETDLGTLTDSTITGGAATLDIKAVIPFHSGSPLCGSAGSTWEGSWVSGAEMVIDKT